MSVAARHFIDGAYSSDSGNLTFENFNPVNGASLGFVPEGGAAEVDAAVGAARASLSGPWGAMA
ncbi:MAG: 5-carboxymethyl-2-hydroxymuconate semialdehyde dehydrogenase, partial [Proteobacteria bacterium]|nr:5-carboxymethyl-2-hydroxymuconate semialdehyde dehydrogenase [Pseudomonadota bacterium]